MIDILLNKNLVEDFKKELLDNLEYLHSLSVEEDTLYRKWINLNLEKWPSKYSSEIRSVKSNIWIPNELNDYMKLKPKIIHVIDEKDNLTWKILRHFIHSAGWNGTVGRSMKFIVIDDITKKYLGVLCLSSDFTEIGGRDKIIKWNRTHKLKLGMLNYTMNCSTIVPTQPLGYNYLGGKLLALLCASNEIEQAFYEKYNQKLVGLTTTSLYGGYSQYSSLKYWKKCETSLGKIELDFTKDIKQKITFFYKNVFPEEYKEILTKPHAGRAVPRLLRKKLDLPRYDNDTPRGVYWCPLYENSNEFLRMEDSILGKKKFDNSVESLTELWKTKYASKRINKCNKLADVLFYDDIIHTKWDIVKNKYLKEVGR